MDALLIFVQKTTNTELQEIWHDIANTINRFLNLGFHIGEGDKQIHLTIGLFLLVVVAFMITSRLLNWLRDFLTRNMPEEDQLKFTTVFKFLRYIVYVIVILLTLDAAGVDITLLITASAAFFVGLGLALQQLFQDLIGGVMIILDQSLHVGDIIEVDGKVGKVFEIKLRTTRAITRDDKVVIIPNHKFISDMVYNYTQNHKTTRESIHIGVAYGSDVQLVTRILEDVAKQHARVLKNPKPFVLFDDFGDSALLFSLNFFINDSFGDPKLKSEMRYEIDAKFRENKVSIPFPQRDVHLYHAGAPGKNSKE